MLRAPIDRNLARLKAARAYSRRLDNIECEGPGFPFDVETETGKIVTMHSPIGFGAERSRVKVLVRRLERGEANG